MVPAREARRPGSEARPVRAVDRDQQQRPVSAISSLHQRHRRAADEEQGIELALWQACPRRHRRDRARLEARSDSRNAEPALRALSRSCPNSSRRRRRACRADPRLTGYAPTSPQRHAPPPETVRRWRGYGSGAAAPEDAAAGDAIRHHVGLRERRVHSVGVDGQTLATAPGLVRTDAIRPGGPHDARRSQR